MSLFPSGVRCCCQETETLNHGILKVVHILSRLLIVAFDATFLGTNRSISWRSSCDSRYHIVFLYFFSVFFFMMNINDVDSDVKVTQLRRREPKKKANEVEGKDGSCKDVVRYMMKHIT